MFLTWILTCRSLTWIIHIHIQVIQLLSEKQQKQMKFHIVYLSLYEKLDWTVFHHHTTVFTHENLWALHVQVHKDFTFTDLALDGLTVIDLCWVRHSLMYSWPKEFHSKQDATNKKAVLTSLIFHRSFWRAFYSSCQNNGNKGLSFSFQATAHCQQSSARSRFINVHCHTNPHFRRFRSEWC